MICGGSFEGADRDGKVHLDSPSASSFARMDADAAKDGRKEVIRPIQLKGQIVITLGNRRDVLRNPGVDGTGVLAADLFLEPLLVRDPNPKSRRRPLLHCPFPLSILRRFDTPKRMRLSRSK